MVKSDKYWEDRERDWINSQIRNDINFDKAIAAKYDELELKMYKEVQAFYVNYAKSANITYAEAKKKVSQFDVNEFSSEASKLVKNKDFSPEANDRLKLYNAKMKINRQMMLASKLGLETAKISSNMTGMTRDKLEKDIYDEAKHQAGILGKTVPERMDLRVKTLVDSSYLGAKWSDRLWINNDKLVSDLNDIINRSLIEGMNPNQLANKLRPHLKDSVNNAKYAMQRLARTESTRVSTEYKQSLYKDQGYKYGEWIAEPSACKRCLPKDGKIYRLDDINIPYHANCRCSFVPNVESAKISNDQDNDIDEFDISSVDKINDFFNKSEIGQINQYIKNAPDGMGDLYKDIFKRVPIAGKSTRNVAYCKNDGVGKQTIYLKDNNIQTLFHEFGHAIDLDRKATKQNGRKLSISINDDVNNFVDPIRKEVSKEKGLKKDQRDLLTRKQVRRVIKSKYGDGEDFDNDYVKTISDMFQSQTSDRKYAIDFDWGHPKNYYTDESTAREFFAEFSSAVMSNKKDLQAIKEVMPESYKEMSKLLKEIQNGGK